MSQCDLQYLGLPCIPTDKGFEAHLYNTFVIQACIAQYHGQSIVHGWLNMYLLHDESHFLHLHQGNEEGYR